MATNNAINKHKPIPLFFAYMAASTGSVTGDSTAVQVPYDSTLFNDGSYNTGTFTFTAPSDGIYLLNSGILTNNTNGKTTMTFQFFIAGASLSTYNCNPSIITLGGYYSNNINSIVQLTTAQAVYVNFYIAGGAKNCSIRSAGVTDPRTWFSATLIG
jgi:hypothetical protein